MSDNADLELRLADIVRASPRLMRVLTTLRELDLPQWRVVSGALYQSVWNHLTGRDPDYGLRDYDVAYFDPDTSWDAEDAFIKRVAAAFEPPLREMVEVRNQARVHLWFEAKFKEPYTALSSADEAIARFVTPAFAAGIRLLPDDSIDVVAPFGLDDMFAMHLRPNPRRPLAAGWARTTSNAKARWPEVTIAEV
jgi:hypothetical protein